MLVVDMSLIFVQSSSLFFNRLNLRLFDQNRSNPKVILSGAKYNMLIAKKHKQILSRKIHFWTRIWSDR